MDYVEWYLVEDLHEWEAIGGDPEKLPEEFPVLALPVGDLIVTVNYDTAKLLTDVYEDGGHCVAWETDDDTPEIH